MKMLKILLFASLSLGALHAQNPPEEAPQSEIIALERQPDGFDLFFTGDPNQLYAVYVSSSDDNWEYLTMGANIQGDVFHVHDDQAGAVGKRLYRVVVLNQDCHQVSPFTTQDLLFRVLYRSYLSRARQDQLQQAAANYHIAMNGVKAAESALKQAQAALVAYLKELSAARFAWIEAQHETEAARKAKRDAERRLADKKKALEEQKAEREKAERMRDQQLHEMKVFLEWAKKFDEEGDSRKADEMRENADEARKRYEFWNDEVGYQDDAVESLKNDIADTESEITEHGENIADKEEAERTAKEDYDSKKAGATPFKEAVDGAKQGVKDAEDAKNDAAKKWADEAKKADKDGKAEKDRQDAKEHEESEAGQAGEPAPKPTAPKPSARAIQIAKFLEHIKAHGGLDAYNDALRSMFGSSLDAGLVTLEGLGAAMAQWATGKAASGAAVGTALASGVVSFGYGIVASWVQDAVGSAVKGIATNTMVGLIFTDAPKPGDAKFSPGTGKYSKTAELYLHNDDGTATVFVFRPSQGMTVKNYNLRKGK